MNRQPGIARLKGCGPCGVLPVGHGHPRSRPLTLGAWCGAVHTASLVLAPLLLSASFGWLGTSATGLPLVTYYSSVDPPTTTDACVAARSFSTISLPTTHLSSHTLIMSTTTTQ